MSKPAERQQWILEQLEQQPLLTFGDCFSRYSVKFSKTQRTFSKDWKTAKAKQDELQAAKAKAIEAEIVQGAVQAVKKGIGDKTDRLLILQRQIEAIQKELETGETTETRITPKGKALQIERPMTANEMAATRRSLKDFMDLMARMLNDYAKVEGEQQTNITINMVAGNEPPVFHSEEDIPDE
jgi:hypothetical protein